MPVQLFKFYIFALLYHLLRICKDLVVSSDANILNLYGLSMLLVSADNSAGIEVIKIFLAISVAGRA